MAKTELTSELVKQHGIEAGATVSGIGAATRNYLLTSPQYTRLNE